MSFFENLYGLTNNIVSGATCGLISLNWGQQQPMRSNLAFEHTPFGQAKRIRPWTSKSGISLYDNNYNIDAQKSSQNKLRAQGYTPYILDYDDGYSIGWSTPEYVANINKYKKVSTTAGAPQKPIKTEHGINEAKAPKKWEELTFWQKVGRGFSNVCKFISNPITSISNYFCGNSEQNPPSQTRSIITGLCDAGIQIVSLFAFPPLFFTSVGATMCAAGIDEAMR